MKTYTLLATFVLALSTPTFGQAPATKLGAFVLVNGGYQATSHDVRDRSALTANAEEGHFDTLYTVKPGPAFNVAGGIGFGPHLGVGVGVSRFTVSTPGTLSASIPHPFFFNRPRQFDGAVPGLRRQELAVHIQARGVMSRGRHLQIAAFAGPSFFRVKQGMVADFSYVDEYPYDSATFRNATTTSGKGSRIGFNAGGDVSFFFTRRLGVGVSAQYAAATVSLPNTAQDNTEVKVGGLQTGGGLRLRF